MKPNRAQRANALERWADEVDTSDLINSSTTTLRSVTLDLPEDILARLLAEADRRDVTIESLITEFASQLPTGTLDDFIGCGDSGLSEPHDVKAQRIRLAAERRSASSPLTADTDVRQLTDDNP